MDEADLGGFGLLCGAALASSGSSCAQCLEGATGTPQSYKPSITPKHSIPLAFTAEFVSGLNFTLKVCLCLVFLHSYALTFAGSDVVQVQLVALLCALQGAFGSKEVAGRLVGLVVSATHL